MSVFEEVKDRVTARQAAEFYGIKVNRRGMACCPFHKDRTPSMKLDKRFHCFGCGADGDVINFVGMMFGLQPLDAAKKLNRDMGLLIPEQDGKKKKRAPPGEAAAHRKAEEARIERAREAQFDRAVKRIHDAWCDYYRLLGKWEKEFAPRSPEDEIHPLFEEAMLRKDHVEHILDILLYGSNEDKARIVIDKGKEVESLERRIRDIESGGGECPAGGVAGPPA